MNLQQLFADVANKMKQDFTITRSAVAHSGLKGSANEETLKHFLRQYLPRAIDISGGQLIDSNHRTSKQLDVILSDSAKTPILYESGDTRVIPVECAYAVFEVKAFLDKDELTKAYENMRSVKGLEKKAFFETEGPIRRTHRLYGANWDNWPIQYFVFAYDSHGLDSVKANLDILQKNDAVHQRIDSICVLDKGVIMNRTAAGLFAALPEPGSVTVASETLNALLLFYVLASVVLNQVGMKDFNIHPYIRNVTF